MVGQYIYFSREKNVIHASYGVIYLEIGVALEIGFVLPEVGIVEPEVDMR